MSAAPALPSALRDTAQRWLAGDCDPASHAELQAVLDRALGGDDAAAADLADRFAGSLTFGTAGLRGPVRAGSNGMNSAVVVRTTAGLVEWLRAAGVPAGTVVIGRDARTGSEAFCAAAAEVFAAAGFDAAVLPEPLPTPMLAFAVRALGAVAGVQITASHNPPEDNGYKLYLGSGDQIVPPADREIEDAIARVPAAAAVSRASSTRILDERIVARYLQVVAQLPLGAARDLRIVLTPLHGVGGPSCVAALREAGFTDVQVVAEQAAPDPLFPTVGFPNPEEPGAADLLLELAESTAADLAIALDPDADRCAIGVREGSRWRMLTGDETGVLLGEHVLSAADSADRLVATTIVSSSMLGSIAAAHGVRYDETPTGFKWLVRSGDGRGTGLVFAYEEALGLCVDPGNVRDKDGISAAVLAADLAATMKARGQTLLDALDRLYAMHGVHTTGQIALRFADTGCVGALMRTLREAPPVTLDGGTVTACDLLPETDALRLRGEGLRVVVRPSGTEPKLKAYLEVVEPPAADMAGAKARAAARFASLHRELSGILNG